jgi:hypothetical protein
MFAFGLKKKRIKIDQRAIGFTDLIPFFEQFWLL